MSVATRIYLGRVLALGQAKVNMLPTKKTGIPYRTQDPTATTQHSAAQSCQTTVAGLSCPEPSLAPSTWTWTSSSPEASPASPTGTRNPPRKALAVTTTPIPPTRQAIFQTPTPHFPTRAQTSQHLQPTPQVTPPAPPLTMEVARPI